MTVRVVCPGSFDPMHVGHLDVFTRAAERFGEVVAAVVDNPNKRAMFSLDERMAFIEAETAGLGNVRAVPFRGLLVDFCAEHEIGVICKGVRGVNDLEYELQMAQMNQRIGGVETLFMSTSPEYSYLSSSLIKEVAKGGGTITGTVPDNVEAAVRRRLEESASS